MQINNDAMLSIADQRTLALATIGASRGGPELIELVSILMNKIKVLEEQNGPSYAEKMNKHLLVQADDHRSAIEAGVGSSIERATKRVDQSTDRRSSVMGIADSKTVGGDSLDQSTEGDRDSRIDQRSDSSHVCPSEHQCMFAPSSEAASQGEPFRILESAETDASINAVGLLSEVPADQMVIFDGAVLRTATAQKKPNSQVEEYQQFLAYLQRQEASENDDQMVLFEELECEAIRAQIALLESQTYEQILKAGTRIRQNRLFVGDHRDVTNIILGKRPRPYWDSKIFGAKEPRNKQQGPIKPSIASVVAPLQEAPMVRSATKLVSSLQTGPSVSMSCLQTAISKTAIGAQLREQKPTGDVLHDHERSSCQQGPATEASVAAPLQEAPMVRSGRGRRLRKQARKRAIIWRIDPSQYQVDLIHRRSRLRGGRSFIRTFEEPRICLSQLELDESLKQQRDFFALGPLEAVKYVIGDHEVAVALQAEFDNEQAIEFQLQQSKPMLDQAANHMQNQDIPISGARRGEELEGQDRDAAYGYNACQCVSSEPYCWLLGGNRQSKHCDDQRSSQLGWHDRIAQMLSSRTELNPDRSTIVDDHSVQKAAQLGYFSNASYFSCNRSQAYGGLFELHDQRTAAVSDGLQEIKPHQPYFQELGKIEQRWPLKLKCVETKAILVEHIASCTTLAHCFDSMVLPENGVLRKHVRYIVSRLRKALVHVKENGIKHVLSYHLRSIMPNTNSQLALLPTLQIEILLESELQWVYVEKPQVKQAQPSELYKRAARKAGQPEKKIIMFPMHTQSQTHANRKRKELPSTRALEGHFKQLKDILTDIQSKGFEPESLVDSLIMEPHRGGICQQNERVESWRRNMNRRHQSRYLFEDLKLKPGSSRPNKRVPIQQLLEDLQAMVGLKEDMIEHTLAQDHSEVDWITSLSTRARQILTLGDRPAWHKVPVKGACLANRLFKMWSCTKHAYSSSTAVTQSGYSLQKHVSFDKAKILRRAIERQKGIDVLVEALRDQSQSQQIEHSKDQMVAGNSNSVVYDGGLAHENEVQQQLIWDADEKITQAGSEALLRFQRQTEIENLGSSSMDETDFKPAGTPIGGQQSTLTAGQSTTGEPSSEMEQTNYVDASIVSQLQLVPQTLRENWLIKWRSNLTTMAETALTEWVLQNRGLQRSTQSVSKQTSGQPEATPAKLLYTALQQHLETARAPIGMNMEGENEEQLV